MSATPVFARPVPPILSTVSHESIGLLVNIVAGTSLSSQTFAVANEAIYIPFMLSRPTVATSLWSANGTNASQTRDLGIYSFDGKKIISTGSTAGSGTSTLQVSSITATTLGAGQYYFAIASSGTTNTFIGMAGTTNNTQLLGVYQQTSAFPLPATATFASITTGHIPVIGLGTVPTI